MLQTRCSVGRLFNAPSENIVIRRVKVLKPLV